MTLHAGRDDQPVNGARNWNRRRFLAAGAVAVAGVAAGCQTYSPTPRDIIDCHTHFYDPTRPGGVPWPRPGETIHRRTLPEDYRKVSASHGVTGTVVVEASAWFSDNRWILDLADRDPFIVGFVGNLTPGRTEFAGQLKELAAHRLFRGIRVSGAAVGGLGQPEALRDLGLLAELDLSLDTNGGVASLGAVAGLAAAVPSLRIVIDHVANVRIDGGEPPREWREGLRRAAQQQNVFCKVSGLVEGSGRRGAAPTNPEFYRPVLDYVWTCFGPARLVYGSNWPVSDLFAGFDTVHGLVRDYFRAKGEPASRRFFSENAATAYRWVQRRSA